MLSVLGTTSTLCILHTAWTKSMRENNWRCHKRGVATSVACWRHDRLAEAWRANRSDAQAASHAFERMHTQERIWRRHTGTSSKCFQAMLKNKTAVATDLSLFFLALFVKPVASEAGVFDARALDLQHKTKIRQEFFVSERCHMKQSSTYQRQDASRLRLLALAVRVRVLLLHPPVSPQTHKSVSNACVQRLF